jgi:hypothetical protein
LYIPIFKKPERETVRAFLFLNSEIMKDEPAMRNNITFIGSVVTTLTTIVYGTWFISTIDKRVSLLEQSNTYVNQRIEEIRQELDTANDAQDRSFIRFQDSINNQISRIMEDKHVINKSPC